LSLLEKGRSNDIHFETGKELIIANAQCRVRCKGGGEKDYSGKGDQELPGMDTKPKGRSRTHSRQRPHLEQNIPREEETRKKRLESTKPCWRGILVLVSLALIVGRKSTANWRKRP